ncbi:FtsH protease activity modulator HflK [bacterium]|nr:FtsH protease activity modulator HflK [bacterium]
MQKKTVSIGGESFEIPDFSFLKGGGTWVVVIILVGIWLLSGIFIVKADEKGVVKRFGQYVRTTGPGIHYRIPFPVETVLKPQVTKVKRSEIGFRTVDPGPPARYAERTNESIMLTGGLNIVDCEMIVQFRIDDPIKHLFKVRDKRVRDIRYPTVHRAAEAALRQVIGKHDVDEALTVGKVRIQEEVKVQLQEILNSYESGLYVVAIQLQDVDPPREVSDAFKDVASAKEDREKSIKQAEGYYNDLIPRTRGKRAQMIKEAEAWAAERIAKAEGDAENFNRILNEYRRSKNVTRKRLLLETMEEILPGLQKYILKADKNGNLMNVLGLQAPIGASKGGK